MINLASIQNPIDLDRNTITGELFEPGINLSSQPVKVSRRQNGWTVRLEIEVAGILLHSDEPTAAERRDFDNLWTRAVENRDTVRTAAKTAAISVARESGLFIRK